MKKYRVESKIFLGRGKLSNEEIKSWSQIFPWLRKTFKWRHIELKPNFSLVEENFQMKKYRVEAKFFLGWGKLSNEDI